MTQHESDELLALFKEEYADFEEAQEILKDKDFLAKKSQWISKVQQRELKQSLVQL